MAFKQPYPSYFLHILLLLPCSIFAQTHISLGSSLTALNDNSSWPSPSGDFAFGFRKIGEDGFLLAIWFNKVKERTIAWSANGNNLVPEGSKVEFTSDGKFILNDVTGKLIWMPESSATGVAFAAMLDTGNFVLVDLNSINLWESFDVPTDTILPTQTLNSTLHARLSVANYSRGRFLFKLGYDGNLLLSTTYFPLDSENFAYWSTPTELNSGFLAIFNQSGSLYLISKNGSILNIVFPNTVSVQDFYHRATLEYDGVLRHYVYPKSTSSSLSWPMAWSTLSFIPSNICLSIRGYTGFGACGFNSICRHDQGPICECPHGYTFIDSNDMLKGCKQNFVPQHCDEASLDMNLFDFQEMQSTNWPNSVYQKFTPRIPLLNGRMDPSVGGKALIKIRKNNSTSIPGGTNTKRKHKYSTLILIGTILLCSLVFLSFLIPFITYMVVSCIYSRKGKEATNGFKEEIRRGASATVFKGLLAFDDAKCIAVKRLSTMVGENELEFKAEVCAIARTNHRNLVKLIGFCNEGQHRLLAYEFMSNGSLATFLFGESGPNWKSRNQIALGVSQGLL
ncbi:putative protein kinase RLK-Pelle-SD-2b family [Rosa chinensis]|uniref:Non-specific serine/threonine protein kinase n=1 Tax=Rosa chinensis TaxID=74649 RepID=A0A2P6QM11_ROSCH|nr:putative protein kinase RLK-Pelle-SD-2b family [Rosa chinensis]